MNKSNLLKTLPLLIGSTLLASCGGGTSGGSTNASTGASSYREVTLNDNSQTRTPASINTVYGISASEISRLSAQATTSTNSCFAIVPQADGKNYTLTINSSPWWSTANVKFAIKNNCATAQQFTNLPVTLSSLLLNGQAATLGEISQSGPMYLTLGKNTSGNNTVVSISTPTCTGDWCSWASYPAGATTTFSAGVTLGGPINSFTVAAVTLDGSVTPPPPSTGTLSVMATSSSTLQALCKASTCASIKVNVFDPSGAKLNEQIVLNPKESSATVVYKNALPGNYTMVTDDTSLPKGATTNYIPTSAIVGVNANATSSAQANFNYTEPAQLGSLQLNLKNISDASNFATVSQINGTVTDTDVTPNQTYTFSVNLNSSYTLSNLPAKHKYNIHLQGIANAQKNSYYAPIDVNAQVVNANSTKSVDLTYTAVAANNLQTTKFTVSGDAVASQAISFADGSYKYATDNTIVNNTNYTFLKAATTVITTSAPSGYTLQTTPSPAVITSGTTSVNFAYTKATTPTSVGTYDFALPTGSGSGIDYSGSFKITFNPNTTTSVTKLQFTSNVPNLDTKVIKDGVSNILNWNSLAVWSKTTDANSGTTTYTITFTDSSGKAANVQLSSGKLLNFTWDPDKQGVPFDTVVPIISNVNIDGKALTIAGACTNCTVDPGKGKKIVGYQEQWSVYPAHLYMPEDIPFSKINVINYAFVDFVSRKTYPHAGVSGEYKVLSADGGADYRQLVELYKAKQRNPHLKVVLSFGGWTNDNEAISPDINFNLMTDAEQRDFAKQAAKLARSMGFDGVDIDWEWWANHRTTSQDACDTSNPKKTVRPGKPYCQGVAVNHDTQKYINLLKYLRAELGNDKLLTIATVSDKGKIASDEDPAVGGVVGAWKQIASYVDYINIMSYDMHGAWDKHTDSQAPWDIDPNSPFYNQPSSFTIKSSIQAYRDFGVPASQLVLGMPAYGRSSIIASAGTTGGLYQASSGAPAGEFDMTGVYTYNCILKGICHKGDPSSTGTKPNVTLHQQGSTMFSNYGGYALTPWGSSSNMYITFDDQNSVKAKFAKACSTFGQLGGGMIWALDGDTTDNTSIVTAVMDNIQCN